MVVSESLVLTGLTFRPRLAPGGSIWPAWVTVMDPGPAAACTWAWKLNGFRSCGPYPGVEALATFSEMTRCFSDRYPIRARNIEKIGMSARSMAAMVKKQG